MPIWGFPTSCPTSWEGEKVEPPRTVGQGLSYPSAVGGAAEGWGVPPPRPCLSVCLSLPHLQPVQREKPSYPADISWRVITSPISDLITVLSICWNRSRLRFSEPHLMMEKPSRELALRSKCKTEKRQFSWEDQNST